MAGLGNNARPIVSYKRLLGRVFSHLGNPADGPNRAGDVYERLLGKLEYFSGFTQTFGGNYLTASYDLPVVPGRTIYDIGDGRFSEPLFAEVLLNGADPTNVGRHRVDIVDRQDLARFTQMDSGERLPSPLTGLLDVTLPRACAWYLEDGAAKLALSNAPSRGLTLRILFEPASPFELEEAEAVPFLPAFLDLLAVATAYDSVELFEFSGMSDRSYQQMLTRITTGIAKGEQVLADYVASDHGEVAGPTEPWGSRRDQQAFGVSNFYGGLL